MDILWAYYIGLILGWLTGPIGWRLIKDALHEHREYRKWLKEIREKRSNEAA